jgi:hypothetical protein
MRLDGGLSQRVFMGFSWVNLIKRDHWVCFVRSFFGFVLWVLGG